VHAKKRQKKGGAEMVKDGGMAPDFELQLNDGKSLRLSSLKGRPVVVYFYPKDDTPGCTTEAKDFSCLLPEFAKAGVEVIGISPDGIASHQKFREKHALEVQLASDPETKVAQAYGAWGEKTNYGKTYMGIIRSTFLVDRTGKVARTWRNVKVQGHAEAVLQAAKALPT
jgi:peroxiredoxin Q/BCP